MARWKPTAKHHLHAEQYGQPTEWERQETNQQTGRMFRKVYKVPLYIDPEDPQMINKHEGFCVLAHKGSERPGDIVFFGPPTPDMEPLDAEAEEITNAERHKWVDPINSLPLQIGEEAGRVILQSLEQQIASQGLGAVSTSLRNVPNKDIEDLKKIVADQQAMINKLIAGQAPAPAHDDPPEDDLPPVEPDVPLVDIDPDALPKPPPIKVNAPRTVARR